MLGSTNKNKGPYGSDEGTDYLYGERAQCELCLEERRCFDRFGMVACANCQRDFLPSGGLF